MASFFNDKLEFQPGMFYVGVQSWETKQYHVYSTPNGTSHNAFLIMDKQVTLIDTVPLQYQFEFFEKIKQLTPLESIVNIIIQHAEQEVTECLPALVQACPNACVICTRKCYEHLIILYPQLSSTRFEIVQPKKPLIIGTKQLSFIQVPLVHWPESMITVCGDIVFTSDLFSQHIASFKRFIDPECQALIEEKAEEFLANEFSRVVPQLIEIIGQVKGFKMLLPTHGMIIKDHYVERVLNLYTNFTQLILANADPSLIAQRPKKIIIVFETLWTATARMADFIAYHLKNNNINICLLNMKLTSLEKLAHESLTATGFAFGSPTLNNGAMPGIVQAVNYLRGLKMVDNKPAIVFGSYGWGDGEGSKYLADQLERSGIRVGGRVIWKYNFDDSVEARMAQVLNQVFMNK
ncbi:A-type_flavoprotein 6 [Hexamita inflata]|uniref:A-type flavoprotein 6 n=1 Tax=Hexamita inflata TaxID=28002 RepID=A0AA86NVM3_9EUKA|nr:A-type flavoprotein 6 [Hexamita inflata]